MGDLIARRVWMPAPAAIGGERGEGGEGGHWPKKISFPWLPVPAEPPDCRVPAIEGPYPLPDAFAPSCTATRASAL